MKLSKKQVESIAYLARLELTEEEKKKFTSELSSILDYVGELDKVDTQKMEPQANITGLSNVMREDEARKSEIIRETLLKNAPMQEKGYLKVRGVFED